MKFFLYFMLIHQIGKKVAINCVFKNSNSIAFLTEEKAKALTLK